MNNIKQITFLRFLAAALVIVVHFGQNIWPFRLEWTSEILKNGAVIVSFFFFLSGTVLGLNYLNDTQFNKRKFFIKRLARVYPVYLLAFIITLFVIMIFNDSYPKGISIILQLLSLHAWKPGICLEINFPAWTVSVEVFFYLLFPFIIKLFAQLSHSKVTFMIILFWLLSALQHYLFSVYLYSPEVSWIGEFILYFPLWHLNCFLFGILCAKYILKRQESGLTKFIRYRLFYILGIVIFLITLCTDNFIRPYLHNGLMAPIYFLILSGLSLDQSFLTRLLSKKIFVLLGNTSYVIYIFQWPVYVCFKALIGTNELNALQFYIYFIMLLLISIFIYIYFESKIRTLIIKNVIKNN